MVAATANIREIKLDAQSDRSAWFGEWLGKLHAGFTDEVKVVVSEHVVIKMIDVHGNETIAHDSAKANKAK